jgi:hypothetical protein
VSVDSETGKSRVVLVAALYMNPGRRAEFDEFETAAARIMRRYGGVIERRIGIAPTDETQPDEVQFCGTAADKEPPPNLPLVRERD